MRLPLPQATISSETEKITPHTLSSRNRIEEGKDIPQPQRVFETPEKMRLCLREFMKRGATKKHVEDSEWNVPAENRTRVSMATASCSNHQTTGTVGLLTHAPNATYPPPVPSRQKFIRAHDLPPAGPMGGTSCKYACDATLAVALSSAATTGSTIHREACDGAPSAALQRMRYNRERCT